MRICFVMLPIEYYSPVSGGAIATVTMNVARELEELGHSVEVITPTDNQPTYPVGRVHYVPQPQDSAPVRLLKHLQARLRKWDSPEYAHYWSHTQRILKNTRPDAVVLANDMESAVLVKRVSPRAAVVSWLHNECRPNRRTGEGLRNTEVFLTCSKYIRRWFLSEFQVKPSAVYTAYAGVDPELFHPEKHRPSGPLRLLYVGRLDPNKGVDAAIDVYQTLKERNVPVSLTVAGGGWFYRRKNRTEESFVQKLRESMERLGVDWLGHVPRRWLPGVIRSHDIALVLSRSQEPFGLVVLEAMSSGVAVLASPHGGLTEACGEAGVLVDATNTGVAADRLEALFRAPGQLLELKQKSIQRAALARWRSTAEVLLRAIEHGQKKIKTRRNDGHENAAVAPVGR